ncbi:hypothetical protein GCM10028798_05220 [Humibacter antri]
MHDVILDRAPIRLDPIGAAAAWGLAPLVGGMSVGYALLQSILNRDEIVSPGLAVAAVCLLVAAGTVLSVAVHPAIGRLSAGGAALVVGAAVAASVLSALSTWGHNRLVQDDWGQIGVALIVFGLLWMRPPWEIGVFGVFGALVVGLLAAAQHTSLYITNTPYVYAVVAATPVLVLGCVAATVGAIIARFSSEWTVSSERGMRALEPEFRMLEHDALRRAQLDELRQATLPLLASVSERGFITQFDIDTATDVSARLREHALEQLRVTWVDSLLADTRIDEQAVHDPERLLPHMPSRERAAFSAFLVESVRIGALDPVGAVITVQRSPTVDSSERTRFELSMRIAAHWRFVRRTARPFVSVLRSLSGDAAITRNGSTMIMRFGFVPA